MGLEELLVFIPKCYLNDVSKGICLARIGLCFALLTCQLTHSSKGFRIAIHITIDSRSGILFLPSTTDALLHPVLNVTLPEDT